ncbi:site-specific DNA-methyltransferase [Psychrobacter sp.]|uniref:site-specific DNA-methyltransferase n=1 Tax=Psychrobacter sp. TaxID=56811 RepID=UPI003C725FDA
MPTLNWIGKEKVQTHHLDVPYRVMEHGYGFTHDDGEQFDPVDSGNKIIYGDNLEALKSLLPLYEGKVDCIYIDPPYNTGNEQWVYNDNVNHPKIKRWLGQVVGKESEDLSRHDKWLCMMYPRLQLLKQLLSHTGVIFISINYFEDSSLKLICDEIFGRGNFISQLAVINNPKGRSDDKYIATAHESILIYRKSDKVITYGFDAEEKITKRYNKKDDNGLYREIDLRKTGSNDTRKARPNMFYPFFWSEKNQQLVLDKENLNDCIEILPIKNSETDGCWRWGKDTAQKKLDRLYARYMPNKKQWSVFERDYLEGRDDVKPTTVWDFKDVNSERGTEVFKNLGFKTEDFPNPKPVGTIERVLTVATKSNPDAIILDSFAGSGTTAHAALNLNKQDGGNRKFILVELEDYANTVTTERVKRVIQGYGEGDNFVEGTGGNFNFYTLGQSLLDDERNLNIEMPIDAVCSYIWYTETNTAYANNTQLLPLLGVYDNTAYYLNYIPNKVTTLDRNFLKNIDIKKSQYVIYADNCLLAKELMQKYNIVFKKIPRDISQF